MRMRKLAGLGLMAVLFVAGAARAADTPEDLGQKAAEAWLKVVDAGQYGASWDTAAPMFKAALTREQWEKAVGQVRTPLGALVSRKLKSRELTHTLPGAPDGLYVVIQYDTVFKNKAVAVETVAPMRDDAGAWKVSGYFIR